MEKVIFHKWIDMENTSEMFSYFCDSYTDMSRLDLYKIYFY